MFINVAFWCHLFFFLQGQKENKWCEVIPTDCNVGKLLWWGLTTLYQSVLTWHDCMSVYEKKIQINKDLFSSFDIFFS